MIAAFDFRPRPVLLEREMPNVSDRWLSVEEIADYLGVSRDTVYAWVSEKGMPGHRVGRLWKFKTAEVDGWVREGGAARKGAPDAEAGR